MWACVSLAVAASSGGTCAAPHLPYLAGPAPAGHRLRQLSLSNKNPGLRGLLG